jgi:hypothetical protein
MSGDNNYYNKTQQKRVIAKVVEKRRMEVSFLLTALVMLLVLVAFQEAQIEQGRRMWANVSASTGP